MLSTETILEFAIQGIENELEQVEKFLATAEGLNNNTMIDFYDDRAAELKRVLHEVKKMEIAKQNKNSNLRFAEVVRCRDCKHDFYCCRLSNRKPHSFCSFGEGAEE